MKKSRFTLPIVNKLYAILFFALVSICTMQVYGAVIYSTGFETPEERSSWTIVNIDEEENNLEWKFGQSFDGYGAMITTFFTFDTGNSWLISPPVSLSDRKYRLKFDLRIQYPGSGSLAITLGNSTNPSDHTSIIQTYTQATQGINPEKQEVYFTPSSPGNCYIAFHYSENVGDVSIDNVEIEEVPDYDLSVTKVEINPQMVKPNENCNINISIRNTGDINQENVSVVIKNIQTQAVIAQKSVANLTSTETNIVNISTSFPNVGLKEISVTVSSSHEDQNPNDNIMMEKILVYSDFQGAGIEANPYQINSKADLIQLTYMVQYGNGFNGAYFVLNTDIDLYSESGKDNGRGWLPIGGIGEIFEGNFDGQGYVIENLFIDRTGFSGLFGYASGGMIKNLGVENADVSGTESTGALIGACGSSVKNCFSTGKVRGFYQTGGLIGDVFDSGENGCLIENCYSTCNITIDRMISGYNASYTGGLIGYIYQATQIKNCYASGSISINNINLQKAVGGLIGGNDPTVLLTSCITANRLLSITPAHAVTNVFGKIIGSYPSSPGVSNNYALDKMKMQIEGIDKAFTESPKNGINKTILELTTQNTYQTLGWSFGESENAPWRFVSGKLPKLWFEKGYPEANKEIVVNRNIYIGSISCSGQDIDYLYAETTEEIYRGELDKYFSEQYKSLLPTENISSDYAAYDKGSGVMNLSSTEIEQAGDWKDIESIAPYFFPTIENMSQEQFNPLNYNISDYESLQDGGYRVEDRSYTTEMTYEYHDGVLVRVTHIVANIFRTTFYASKLSGTSSQTGIFAITPDNIRIEPTFVSDYIHIVNLPAGAIIRIIDSNGKIVLDRIDMAEINVSYLLQGLYLLQITRPDDSVVVLRFVKR